MTMRHHDRHLLIAGGVAARFSRGKIFRLTEGRPGRGQADGSWRTEDRGESTCDDLSRWVLRGGADVLGATPLDCRSPIRVGDKLCGNDGSVASLPISYQ